MRVYLNNGKCCDSCVFIIRLCSHSLNLPEKTRRWLVQSPGFAPTRRACRGFQMGVANYVSLLWRPIAQSKGYELRSTADFSRSLLTRLYYEDPWYLPACRCASRSGKTAGAGFYWFPTDPQKRELWKRTIVCWKPGWKGNDLSSVFIHQKLTFVRNCMPGPPPFQHATYVHPRSSG